MTVPEDITFKKVKVSGKGLVTILSDIRKTMKIKKGEELLIVRKGDKLPVEKSSSIQESCIGA